MRSGGLFIAVSGHVIWGLGQKMKNVPYLLVLRETPVKDDPGYKATASFCLGRPEAQRLVMTLKG